MTTLLDDFTARGLVETVSNPALGALLGRESVSFYVGFDPTAPSLQIGNLFALVMMRRLQMAGHKPIAIVGGATGMIGDPSGKSQERNLLDAATINQNIAGQQAQMERLLDFSCGANSAAVLNNHDWLGSFRLLDFLRDVGKRFRMSEMLAKESVRSRLDSDAGMSFTEFTYQMLQAYDFLYLYQQHQVKLQIGGGDQWGNITAGLDLIRKEVEGEAYGLVIPLVTDGQGQKFGKSEGGAIFLDPTLTSPYQMYQYLLNSDDRSVIVYLKYFTFLTLDEIGEIERETAANPGARAAQRTLAETVTEMVHGAAGLASARQASRVLFGEPIESLSDAELASIFADVPSVTLAREKFAAGIPVLDFLAATPLFKSKGDARRTVEQNGAYLNNRPVHAVDAIITTKDFASESALVVRKGKKNYCLVKVA